MSRYSPARMREARESAGLSFAEAATLAATALGTLALFEKGTVIPEPGLLQRLAEVYGVESLYDAGDPGDPVVRFQAEMIELARRAPRLSAAKRAELRSVLYGT